jgi:hypothetical protein
MPAFTQTLLRSVMVLTVAALLVVSRPIAAQTLPWEITLAEIEAGRIRHLAQRLNKQNVLFHLHVGGVSKEDVIRTAGSIDEILRDLEEGVPSRSIPSPWTEKIREQVRAVDAAWAPLRSIAIASPYEHLRVAHQFLPRGNRRGDPLLLIYFDGLVEDLVKAANKLVATYDAECRKTGLGVCDAASTTGYAAMLIERAAKEAVYLVANIEPKKNRERLEKTIAAYQEVQQGNNSSTFFKAALDPKRGISAKAAGELLVNLRKDWVVIQDQFTILAAGDEQNFDLRVLLIAENRMVEKVERLTAALVRYANLTYGS